MYVIKSLSSLIPFIMALRLNMVLNWYDVIELLKQSLIRSSSWKLLCRLSAIICRYICRYAQYETHLYSCMALLQWQHALFVFIQVALLGAHKRSVCWIKVVTDCF